MAPKKNKQKAKAQSGPKLQISAENENRLPTTATAADDTLTKAQKAKKLKAVYEKLSCEGFGNHQIELSLSALREAATFESALDWLCLNLPGNELPLKFSTGISHYDQGGSVGVISNQPAVDAASITIEEEAPESPVLIRRQWKNDDTLDSRLTSQADWIRQYVEQQEEDESESWEDDIFFDGRSAKHKPCEPRSYDVIAKEYLAARLEATKAKEKRDKNRQEQAGHIIRKLKQELSALGLSDDSLALEHEHEISYTFKSERASTGPEAVDCFKEKTPCDTEGLASGKTEVAESDVESHSMVEHLVKSGSLVVHVEKDSAQGEVGDIELGGLFLEDASPSEILPPDILKVQKQEKIRRLSEKNLDKLDGIWKKGDPQKIPKAVLHQLCQKSGWEAPKFDKILGRGKIFSYTVSILRKASGRGKNRKAGGLVTLQLPDQNETVESAEDMLNIRATLPIAALKGDILKLMEEHDFLVVCGETGSGKTTQVPQFILDDMIESGHGGYCNIICTQPRRIAGDFLLIVLKNLIEKQSTNSSGKLKIILMSATVDSSLFSRYFNNCPVVTAEGRTHPVTTYFLEDIYDQIEYRLASDSPASLTDGTFPKGQRDVVTNSRGKKNLVLSAWGDESLLSEEHFNPYFVPSYYQLCSEQTQQNMKRLNEDVIDYDLLEDLICFIDETCDEGAILVFLPGMSEINYLHDKLVASSQFGGPSSEWVIPLHSAVASSEQKRVFLRPPGNIRKVVIATNIAETSITIDDVIYVIDCGKHKENRYNPQKKLSSMVEDWISRANATQRRGRAGRVKPGICFSLYTRHRFEKLMRPYQVPEMLRMPLVELCLQIKLLSLGYIKPFLSEALEPPKVEAMDSAISLLYEVGALEGDEELTPLGHHLAKLPVDVLIGKMMLYGAMFGCLSPILSVAAFLSYKSPFVYPKDERQNVERAKLTLLNDKLDGPGNTNDIDRQSDHLLMMTAYKRWERILTEKGAKAAQKFCNSFFLSCSVMFMIREMRVQFGTLLADIGLITLPKDYQKNAKKIGSLDSWLSDVSQPFNIYAHHSSILKAILCAGLYPNVAAGEQGIVAAVLSSLKQSSSSASSGRTVWFDGRREVHIHPSSINNNSKGFQYPFLVFLEKVETNKVFLRDTSVISPYSILLFGGSIDVLHQTGQLIIDGWLKLTAPAQIAVLFKELRLALHSILKELIRKPENATVLNNEIIKSIITLLLEEGSIPQ
ncbi:ATP-dependent RNA helicase DHX29 [Glycine soja]|nr:ATP-dependent RNA helicase DHX29 [Glycine soja]